MNVWIDLWFYVHDKDLDIVREEDVKYSERDDEHESPEQVNPSPPSHPQSHSICYHICECLGGLQERMHDWGNILILLTFSSNNQIRCVTHALLCVPLLNSYMQ